MKKSQQKEEKKAELVSVENELESMQSQCSVQKDTIKSLDSEFISFMTKTEEQSNILLVNHGNLLKRTSEKKQEQFSVLEKRVQDFFIFFYLCIFYPGTMTTHAESINSDLQRGLDRHLRHTQHRTRNRTSKPLKYQRTTNTTATPVVKY